MLDLDERLKRGPLRVQSIWSVEQTRSLGREVLSRRRRRFAYRVALGVACASALLFAATRLYRASAAGHPATLAAANAASHAGVHYADGSVAELTSTGTVVHLDQETPVFVSSTVVTGRARFDVLHNQARTFEVHAGDVTVRVLGTAFVVERAGSGAHVSVERGRVRVAWPGGEALLGVGEAGEFPPPQAAAEPESSAVPVEALDLEAPGAESPSAEPTGAEPRVVWRDFARRGQYAQAFAALRRTPNDVREEPADLLLAADVARLSSHPAQAVAPLRRVCERYSKDARAPVAAFTLGRVLLDDLGRAAEAASAFDLASRLWPSGPLASDALAREAEALKRAGQLPQARAVAQKYLALHPGGRHASSLRAMLDIE
jgi:transmembrane sensor